MGPRAGLNRAANLVPTGTRSRTLQPSQSLYRLSYPAHIIHTAYHIPRHKRGKYIFRSTEEWEVEITSLNYNEEDSGNIFARCVNESAFMVSSVALLAVFCNGYFFPFSSTSPSGSKSLIVET